MKQLLIPLVLLTLLFGSCRQHNKTADTIIKATVTNEEGVKLDMEYNNSRHTARFILGGEVIDLKQDTMGSGIKYSNNRYEYREWHGEITLKKDGKAIFASGFKK